MGTNSRYRKDLGWWILIVALFLIIQKSSFDQFAVKKYRQVNAILSEARRIDKEFLNNYWPEEMHISIGAILRVQVGHGQVGNLVFYDDEDVEQIKNYMCMLHAHNSLHRTFLITWNKASEAVVKDRYPLATAFTIDIEAMLANSPLIGSERSLLRAHLQRIIRVRTVAMFAKLEYDFLVTTPWAIWTKNMTEVILRTNIYVPYELLPKMHLYGRIGNDMTRLPLADFLAAGETFVQIGKKQNARWLQNAADSLHHHFYDQRGLLSHHCSDVRAKCRPMSYALYATTDWFMGTREQVPNLLDLDRREFRTPAAIRTLRADFAGPNGTCDVKKVWKFGSQLTSANFPTADFPSDRLRSIRSARPHKGPISSESARRNFARWSLIDSLL